MFHVNWHIKYNIFYVKNCTNWNWDKFLYRRWKLSCTKNWISIKYTSKQVIALSYYYYNKIPFNLSTQLQGFTLQQMIVSSRIKYFILFHNYVRHNWTYYHCCHLSPEAGWSEAQWQSFLKSSGILYSNIIPLSHVNLWFEALHPYLTDIPCKPARTETF
jgi:hypothetical protein